MKKVKLTHPNLIELLKGKVTTRSYKNKEGQLITLQEIDLEIVEQKKESHKQIFKNEKVTITKTGFVALSQSKEEIERQDSKIFVGDIQQFEFPNRQIEVKVQTDDLPF